MATFADLLQTAEKYDNLLTTILSAGALSWLQAHATGITFPYPDSPALGQQGTYLHHSTPLHIEVLMSNNRLYWIEITDQHHRYQYTFLFGRVDVRTLFLPDPNKATYHGLVTHFYVVDSTGYSGDRGTIHCPTWYHLCFDNGTYLYEMRNGIKTLAPAESAMCARNYNSDDSSDEYY